VARVDDRRARILLATASTLSRDGAEVAQLVGLDATPLASSHAVRGIGRYVEGVISALLAEEPLWCLDHLGLLSVSGQSGLASTPPKFREAWARPAPPIRAQDLGWAWAAITDRIAIAGGRPDLWHQTDPGSPVSPLATRQTITTAYDLIPLHEPDVMARIRPHRRLIYQLYLRSLRRAQMIVAISETTADDLVETLGIPRERIRVVYPVVKPLVAPSIEPPAVSAAGTAPQIADPRFLFVGIPDPHKRPDLAVAAFARFAAAHHAGRLTFVGIHPDAIRRRLRDQSERLGVAGAVEFVDRVDDGTLASMYASGVLLTLSRREGFGLPPVEALLTGGQAVAVPGAIYDEVLGDAAVRAESDDPDAIARAMSLACDRRPDSVAIERIQARYCPAAMSTALRAVYEEALGRIDAGDHAD
jgi:glycosyltransferase involved in cell wall biosynthesis